MTKLSLASALRAAALVAVCACAGSALAQAPAAPPAPAAGAIAAPPPVAKPPVSPAHLDAATEVLRLSGMSRSIDLIVPQMLESARRMFTQMRPEAVAELEKTMRALEPDWIEQATLVTRIAAEAFADKLSEPELKDMKTFFSSESGKKFVSVQPTLLNDMMRNLDSFNARLSQVVVDKIQADLKKRNVPF